MLFLFWHAWLEHTKDLGLGLLHHAMPRHAMLTIAFRQVKYHVLHSTLFCWSSSSRGEQHSWDPRPRGSARRNASFLLVGKPRLARQGKCKGRPERSGGI